MTGQLISNQDSNCGGEKFSHHVPVPIPTAQILCDFCCSVGPSETSNMHIHLEGNVCYNSAFMMTLTVSVTSPHSPDHDFSRCGLPTFHIDILTSLESREIIFVSKTEINLLFDIM